MIAQLKLLLASLGITISTIGPSVYTLIPSNDTESPAQSTLPSPNNISRNWSGYVADGGTFTSVNGSWVVPSVTTDNFIAAEAAWVGIGGLNTDDLIQAGTQAIVDNQGNVDYSAFYEMLPEASRPIPLSVTSGDSVTVVITKQEGDEWLIEFKNNTTDKAFQKTVTYKSSMSSADWIEEAPSTRRGFLPLADFGQIHFTNAQTTKDGKLVNLLEAQAEPVIMFDEFDSVAAIPTMINPDNVSFTVNRASTKDKTSTENDYVIEIR